MGDGLRTIRVVTTDETLLASTRSAAEGIDGWEVSGVADVAELLRQPPALGDVVLLDNWLRGENVYEICRRLTGTTRCRTFVVVERGNERSEPIARFCGAVGTIERPVVASALEAALDGSSGPRPGLPQDGRGQSGPEPVLPEELLLDLTGKPDRSLVAALTDPETSLFNYAFLNYKLDEEFKRSRRFDQPLSCVMLGFEGQVTGEVLSRLAGIFLETSRDTDILGRFDESSFLFLLPNTGPDGAAVMARRVGDLAQQQGLRDLVGDPLVISVGIACCPSPQVRKREDLFGLAREAFLSARHEGGGVIAAG